MTSIPVHRTVQSLRKWRRSLKQTTRVGLVPTMGALHEGHLSLVKQSLQDCQHTVISIFVNPSQFAPGEDLDSYPRTWDTDIRMLNELLVKGKSVDDGELVIFAPTVSGMYPSGIKLDPKEQKGTFVQVLGPCETLEGRSRPLFFRGVCTVVLKLINATQPDIAYFGQKDVQQCIVVKRMVDDLLLGLEIRVMPIIRESNGLAMSSRNQYLSEVVKQKCGLIYTALKKGKESATTGVNVVNEVLKVLKTEPLLFEVDYVSVNEPVDLKDREGCIETGDVLSLAVFVNQGEDKPRVRLIDNVIL